MKKSPIKQLLKKAKNNKQIIPKSNLIQIKGGTDIVEEEGDLMPSQTGSIFIVEEEGTM